MSLIVQKFGGSSVGTVERIGLVADRVAQRRRDGVSLIVVVSAMQGETDRLMGLAHAIEEDPDPRESDQLLATGEQVSAALLAIALRSRGVPARSLTAAQMRLRTDGFFQRARIRTIDREIVQRALDGGEVVVATGFQGIDADGNVTTLGRGGSDTSAVALTAALGASECEIYTDVLGVYTADPNLCPRARKLDEISFEEMLELASQGAKVLQIRSVELAMKQGVPLRVRSTFSDDPGTLVRAADEALEEVSVRGISYNKNEVKLTLRHVPDRPGVAAKIFTALAASQINVDVIVQNTSEAGTTDLSFTVGRSDGKRANEILQSISDEVAADGIEFDSSIAKISIVGVGMRSHPGVAATMFETLHTAGINIQMITTSEIKVTCVIERSGVDEAVRALHDAFALHEASNAPRKKKKTKKKSKKKKKKAKAKKTRTAARR